MMPNVATWWCGHDAERAMSAPMPTRMVIGAPFRSPLQRSASQSQLRRGRRTAADSAPAERNGRHFRRPRAVTLSTTPVWEDGSWYAAPAQPACLPRPHGGWLDGDARRLRPHRPLQDPKAVAMQSGGSVADVWIVSDHPVAAETMLPLRTAALCAAASGRAAQPRRRQPVLARALCRARRSDDAAVARLFHVRLAEAGEPQSPLLDYARDYIEELGYRRRRSCAGWRCGMVWTPR
jgi:hypothetical protein